jgi:Tol biopolymer transport system component
VLLAHGRTRTFVNCLIAGQDRERDLSWFDVSIPWDLSDDGTTLLFDEEGAGGGSANYTVYLRRTDGSPAVRLGEGQAQALSPDGQCVLAKEVQSVPNQLFLIPTGSEPCPRLAEDSIHHRLGRWLPDGKRILFEGSEPGRRSRLFVEEVPGGPPRAISPEGTTLPYGRSVSPDGRLVVGKDPDGRFRLYPVEGGIAQLITGLAPGEIPVGWIRNGRSLLVRHARGMPATIFLLDLSTGRRQVWRELTPADMAGVWGIWGIGQILITPDTRSYAYGFFRTLSDLYVVEGLR